MGRMLMEIRDELKWPSETGTVGQVLVERITKDGKISHTFEDDPADLERMTEEEKSAIFEEDELMYSRKYIENLIENLPYPARGAVSDRLIDFLYQLYKDVEELKDFKDSVEAAGWEPYGPHTKIKREV